MDTLGNFYLRDAMLARNLLSSCVCPSVRHTPVLYCTKWLNVESRKQRHVIAQGLYSFFDANSGKS